MVVGSITMYNPQLLYPDFFENMYTNSLVSYWVKIRMRDWLSVWGTHVLFWHREGIFFTKNWDKISTKIGQFCTFIFEFF